MNTRLESSSPELQKLFFSRSIIMEELLLSAGSNVYPCQQNNLWDELIQSISISKNLSVMYVASFKDQNSDSKEILNDFKKSNENTHAALETFLNSFITQEFDNVHNTSSDIETRHNQKQISPDNIVHYEWHLRSSDGHFRINPKNCVLGVTRYQSRCRSQEYISSSEAELRYKTKFRSQSRNLSRSPSNSHIPTQSRNVYWSSLDSFDPTQYEVRKKSRSKSQEHHEYDSRSMNSSVTRHRPRSRNLNRSPSNFRIQAEHGRRNRSRSRSGNEQLFDSRSRYSSKNRQRSKNRIRKRSQSKSLDRRDNVTEHQSSSKSKDDLNHPSKSSKNYKLKSIIRQRHNAHSPQNKSQHPIGKWKKSKSTQLTESTSSSDTSQLEEEPPVPGVNSSTTTIPSSQVGCQVPRPFYSHSVTPMYYAHAQPTHMPRLMPIQYYMPPRPGLTYPPTYPRMLYRPQYPTASLQY